MTIVQSDLSSFVSSVKGVGPKLSKLFASMSIVSLKDVLLHHPIRYDDRTRITPVYSWGHQRTVLIEAEVIDSTIQYRPKRQLLCRVKVQDKTVSLRFFHFYKPQQQAFSVAGQRIILFGRLSLFKEQWFMVHPEYQLLNKDEPLPLEASLRPIYSTIEGLSQKVWMKVGTHALAIWDPEGDHISKGFFDYLPDQANRGLSLLASIKMVHRPPPGDDASLLVSNEHPAQQRLLMEDCVISQLRLLLGR